MKGLLALLGATIAGWLLLNLIGALLVGAIARAILPGRDRVGWFTTIAIGFLGGIVGKVAAFAIGWRHLGIARGFCVSVVGALVLLIAHRIWSASRAKRGAAA
jgi:uncharacterized membrane protein YeaQ/YmgE (transglycosylase-associated protein family)